MSPEENFRKVAPKYMSLFMKDFNATREDAAAVFGNAGYESLGFTKLQEIQPKGGRGGYGWFQWTGPRRTAFEAYCNRNDLDINQHDSNYKFLFTELKGPEKASLTRLMMADGLNNKVIAFEQGYERAGVKNYKERQKWAQIALDANKTVETVDIPSEPSKPSESPVWLKLIEVLIKLITGRL